jgi:hypothetical protein
MTLRVARDLFAVMTFLSFSLLCFKKIGIESLSLFSSVEECINVGALMITKVFNLIKIFSSEGEGEDKLYINDSL